jgi:hypothetical protein
MVAARRVTFNLFTDEARSVNSSFKGNAALSCFSRFVPDQLVRIARHSQRSCKRVTFWDQPEAPPLQPPFWPQHLLALGQLKLRAPGRRTLVCNAGMNPCHQMQGQMQQQVQQTQRVLARPKRRADFGLQQRQHRQQPSVSVWCLTQRQQGLPLQWLCAARVCSLATSKKNRNPRSVLHNTDSSKESNVL